MILITGAAGKTGRTLINTLSQQNTPVRALVRRLEQEQPIKEAGAQHVIVGDLLDESAVHRAMSGVTALYHICPNMHPDELQIGRLLITAAQAAGVGRFIYHSVLHPQTPQMPHHWQKLQVEAALFESGLPYTILQPAPYMQNLLAGWQAIIAEGIYRVPYALTTRLSLVDLHDIAEVAAKLLLEPNHQGATYELVGTAALTQHEVAATLSQLFGRPITAEALPREQWLQQATTARLTDYARATLMQMFDYYEQYGLWGNPNVLSWLLGRPPTSLLSFAQRIVSQHSA
jgi:NAD(P)H dehydrogenase (quinone)